MRIVDGPHPAPRIREYRVERFFAEREVAPMRPFGDPRLMIALGPAPGSELVLQGF